MMSDLMASGKAAMTCVLMWWALITSLVFLLAVAVALLHPDPKRRREARDLLVLLRESFRGWFRRGTN
ncbi:hypothetical protein ACQP0C_00665 [Nocardia sp. CA-129566]|uniref:hypothetical protein n=1 Tax=Nocardia sp. CA-129566 TaxID=3239976 RepID=UPI003D99DC73